MIKRLLVVILAFLCIGHGVAAAKATHKQRTQKVTVDLTVRGYQPETFRLRKGIRAQVTFVRKTEDACGQVVVLPAYGIRRDLPLNQPVTVTFTPRKAGTFSFVCGMDMLRGTIIVS